MEHQQTSDVLKYLFALFVIHLEIIFHSYGDVTITGEGLQILT